MAYQSFDGQKGDSASSEKLAAIRLPEDLTGKSVLDIGCNEGFFCDISLKRGANRVVGIDINQDLVKKAKNRFPDAEFRHASWWGVGDEQFDYILFLSAIHYEPEQKRLLRKLLNNLKPNGTLILEGGAEPDYVRRDWKWVARHDGLVRFPTFAMLFDDLMTEYSVRVIGPSVQQSGDPQSRFVFHCTRRKPVIFCISGESGAGKSSFARQFAQRDIRVIHLDPVLGLFASMKEGRNQGFVDYIRKSLSATNYDIYQFVKIAEREDRIEDLGRFIFSLAVKDDDLTIMEGFPFSSKRLSVEFRKIAEENGFRVVFAQLD